MLFRMSERNPEATRKAIIEAAAAELLERGYSGASLSRIAARLHVTTGALAYHFPTKSKLLDVLAEALLRAVTDTYSRAMRTFPGSGSRTCVAHMAAFGHAITDDVVIAAGASLFTDPSVSAEVVAPVMSELHRMVTECFAQAVAEERVELSLPLAQASEYFLASLMGSMVTSRYFTELAVDRDRLQFTQLALWAVGFSTADQIVADVLRAVAQGHIALPAQTQEIYAALQPKQTQH